MSLAPDTPDRPTTRSGQLTPGMVSEQLSKMDFPAPTNLQLNIPPSKGPKPLSPVPDSASVFSDGETGDISGPEPEAITELRRKTRSESMSAELSDALSKMKLPQPERIFGPDEGESEAAREVNKGKAGVSADEWEKLGLKDEVPEAVKEPAKMTHSRNVSRA